jgi:hypothetical protein
MPVRDVGHGQAHTLQIAFQRFLIDIIAVDVCAGGRFEPRQLIG